MRCRQRLALSAVLAVCITYTASCAQQTDVGAAVTTGAVTQPPQTESVTEEDRLPAPKLPEMDFGGETYTVMTMGWYNYDPLAIKDIAPAETNGESLNDAAYARNLAIREAYNCEIAAEDFIDNDQCFDVFKKAVMAGDDVYDIALMRGNYYKSMITGGMLMDLSAVPHIDLNAPYYDQASLSALKVLNVPFAIVSNLTMLRLHNANCAYVNLQLLEQYDLGNIYEVVNAGEWTLDCLLSYGKHHAADINADNKNDNQDNYAATYIHDSVDGLIGASGVLLASLDDNGEFILSYDSEEAIGRMKRVWDGLYDHAQTFNCHTRSDNANADEVGMFMERQAMFSLGTINYGPQFRPMEDDFAILPMPKLDAADAYITPVAMHVLPLTVIPVSAQRIEEIGILTELLSYYGYVDLYPEIYETVLKTKIARDEESTAMIDMIFENTVYDTGLLFQFGDMMNRIRTLYTNRSDNFASMFEKQKNRVQKDVDAVLEEAVRVMELS